MHTNSVSKQHPWIISRRHRLFHPNFGVSLLDQIAHVGVSPSISFKLIGGEIIFEVFQPMWSRYLNVTDKHDHEGMMNQEER